MLPLTCTLASANQNEQKHSLNLMDKTKLILKQSASRLRSVIADSQYSDNKLRNAVGETVIPYRANQKRSIARAFAVAVKSHQLFRAKVAFNLFASSNCIAVVLKPQCVLILKYLYTRYFSIYFKSIYAINKVIIVKDA
jgi:hypothetical protein